MKLEITITREPDTCRDIAYARKQKAIEAKRFKWLFPVLVFCSITNVLLTALVPQ